MLRWLAIALSPLLAFLLGFVPTYLLLAILWSAPAS